MLHFLLGSAVIVLPKGNLALLAAIGAVKGAGECWTVASLYTAMHSSATGSTVRNNGWCWTQTTSSTAVSAVVESYIEATIQLCQAIVRLSSDLGLRTGLCMNVCNATLL